MSSILKQSGKSARDLAKLAARQITYEKGEFAKSVKKQTVGEVAKESPLIEQIVTEGGKFSEPTKQEKVQLEAKTTKRIEELEKELEEVRRSRQEQYEEWKKSQEEQMKVEIPIQGKPLLEPTSRPKRGMLGVVKKKQGTKEMGKTLSG